MTNELRRVKAALAPFGMTVSDRRHDGEYRVNFKGGSEATAYYTCDADDAIATGIDMRRREAYAAHGIEAQ